MAKYQKYAEYKDSGIEWLGEIPSHWKVVKLSYKLRLLSGDGITAFDIEDTGTYPVFGGNGLRGFTEKYNCDGEYALVGRQGALCGNINVARGKFFATEHAVVVYPYEKFNLTYLSEFLRFMDLGQYSVSAAQPGIAVDRINALPIVIPTLDEQNSIGDFLDHETAKIDHLIEKQQQLIELLKEKRQAVISHAVTKGLDPNVPMKDSGVAWLGEVPEHWDVSKFAYLKQVLTDYTANGSFADLKANVQYLDEPSFARLVRLTDLRKDLANTDGVWVNKKSYEYLKKSALYGGEFLLANVGAYAGLFYQMPFDKGYASLAPNMFMAKFDQSKVSREFMAYVGQSIPVSSQLRLSATASSAQPKLNKDDFKAVSFVYPGLKEQQKIVDYLDQELKQIDILLKKQEQAISLMQERRTALISAAVTGKIDVRNWQAPTVAEAQTEFSA